MEECWGLEVLTPMVRHQMRHHVVDHTLLQPEAESEQQGSPFHFFLHQRQALQIQQREVLGYLRNLELPTLTVEDMPVLNHG